MSSLSPSFACHGQPGQEPTAVGFRASLCPQSPGVVVQLSVREREAIASTCGCLTKSTHFLGKLFGLC